MKLFVLALVFFASSALAQQAPQSACEKSLFEISGFSQVMITRLQDQTASLQQEAARLQAEIKTLKEKYEPAPAK